MSEDPYKQSYAAFVKKEKTIGYVAFGTFLVVAAVGVGSAVFNPSSSFEIKLSAPTSIVVGEIAVLDVGATGADSYAFSVSPPAKCYPFENGTKLVFASGASGEYLFIVAAAKGGQVSIAEHTVTVEGEVGPAPGPAAFATRLKQALAAVNDPDKAAHLSALGGTFSTIASMIASGVLTDPEEIVTATANLNTEALGSASEAWKPVRDCLSTEMNARSEAGSLETAEQYAAAWKEIASLLKGAPT